MEEDLPEGSGTGKETAERAGKAPVAVTAAAYGTFTQPARACLHAEARGYIYTSR